MFKNLVLFSILLVSRIADAASPDMSPDPTLASLRADAIKRARALNKSEEVSAAHLKKSSEVVSRTIHELEDGDICSIFQKLFYMYANECWLDPQVPYDACVTQYDNILPTQLHERRLILLRDLQYKFQTGQLFSGVSIASPKPWQPHSRQRVVSMRLENVPYQPYGIFLSDFMQDYSTNPLMSLLTRPEHAIISSSPIMDRRDKWLYKSKNTTTRADLAVTLEGVKNPHEDHPRLLGELIALTESIDKVNSQDHCHFYGLPNIITPKGLEAMTEIMSSLIFAEYELAFLAHTRAIETLVENMRNKLELAHRNTQIPPTEMFLQAVLKRQTLKDLTHNNQHLHDLVCMTHILNNPSTKIDENTPLDQLLQPYEVSSFPAGTLAQDLHSGVFLGALNFVRSFGKKLYPCDLHGTPVGNSVQILEEKQVDALVNALRDWFTRLEIFRGTQHVLLLMKYQRDQLYPEDEAVDAAPDAPGADEDSSEDELAYDDSDEEEVAGGFLSEHATQDAIDEIVAAANRQAHRVTTSDLDTLLQTNKVVKGALHDEILAIISTLAGHLPALQPLQDLAKTLSKFLFMDPLPITPLLSPTLRAILAEDVLPPHMDVLGQPHHTAALSALLQRNNSPTQANTDDLTAWSNAMGQLLSSGGLDRMFQGSRASWWAATEQSLGYFPQQPEALKLLLDEVAAIRVYAENDGLQCSHHPNIRLHPYVQEAFRKAVILDNRCIDRVQARSRDILPAYLSDTTTPGELCYAPISEWHTVITRELAWLQKAYLLLSHDMWEVIRDIADPTRRAVLTNENIDILSARNMLVRHMNVFLQFSRDGYLDMPHGFTIETHAETSGEELLGYPGYTDNPIAPTRSGATKGALASLCNATQIQAVLDHLPHAGYDVLKSVYTPYTGGIDLKTDLREPLAVLQKANALSIQERGLLREEERSACITALSDWLCREFYAILLGSPVHYHKNTDSPLPDWLGRSLFAFDAEKKIFIPAQMGADLRLESGRAWFCCEEVAPCCIILIDTHEPQPSTHETSSV